MPISSPTSPGSPFRTNTGKSVIFNRGRSADGPPSIAGGPGASFQLARVESAMTESTHLEKTLTSQSKVPSGLRADSPDHRRASASSIRMPTSPSNRESLLAEREAAVSTRQARLLNLRQGSAGDAAEVAARERAVAQREVTLETRERAQEEREEEFRLRIEELDRAQREVQTLRRALKAEDLDLAERLKKVQQIEQRVSTAERELTTRGTEWAARERELTRAEDRVRTKVDSSLSELREQGAVQALSSERTRQQEERLKSREQQLAVREARISRREIAVADRDEVVSQREAQCGARVRSLNERDAAVTAREQHLRNKEDHCHRQQEALEEGMAKVRQRLAEREQRVQAREAKVVEQEAVLCLRKREVDDRASDADRRQRAAMDAAQKVQRRMMTLQAKEAEPPSPDKQAAAAEVASRLAAVASREAAASARERLVTEAELAHRLAVKSDFTPAPAPQANDGASLFGPVHVSPQMSPERRLWVPAQSPERHVSPARNKIHQAPDHETAPPLEIRNISAGLLSTRRPSYRGPSKDMQMSQSDSRMGKSLFAPEASSSMFRKKSPPSLEVGSLRLN
eukprot:Hpha_TRINITY_DN16099_c2_g6::TRINITY_DN16099_c2_g6_i1::g.118990::m.118990